MGKGLWIGFGALFLSAGASVYGLYRLATGFLDYGAASGELPAAVAAYRGDGLPFVAREVAPPRLAPEADAAPAIRAAERAMPDRATGARLANALKRPGPEADRLLQTSYAKPLALVAAVQERPGADFRRDWDLGAYVLFPEYATMKGLARAAVLRAERAATRGDDEAALRDLDLARRLALWAGGEPSLISLLVRIATESIALDGAERCLVRAAGKGGRIDRYRRWIAASSPLPRLADALRGEAFLGVATMRNLAPFGGLRTLTDLDGKALAQKIDPKTLKRDGLPAELASKAYLTRHLQLWHEAYAATDGFRRPPEELGRSLDALAARLETKKSLSYVLARILFPVYTQAGAAIVQLEARRAVRAGFAEALAVHAATGRWPTKVAGEDPFAHAPLKVRLGTEFRVYSVGRDRKDDGGLLRREAPKKPDATFDEVAAYPPAPR